MKYGPRSTLLSPLALGCVFFFFCLGCEENKQYSSCCMDKPVFPATVLLMSAGCRSYIGNGFATIVLRALVGKAACLLFLE